MYKIRLELLGANLNAFSTIYAKNHEDLRALVTLAPEAGYEIVKVERDENLQTVSEFLEEIKDKIKPKDLVFGIDDVDPSFSTGNQSEKVDGNTLMYPPKVQESETKGDSEEKSNQKEK